MKFLLVALFTSLTLAQKADIQLVDNEFERVGGHGFGCYRTKNKAWGIRAPRNVEVRLFKNGDCEGGSYLRSWGRAKFRMPFEFRSVQLVHRGSGGSYDDCEDNDDGDSGYDSYDN